ncbi:MAG: hypothetical protein A2133_07035 [Actinobacteria bacterium RBG_16_64_13]|nr:MAG: hypothetical protein A2133_07035 [Actinobacteria bacterium RBG_16_64_13]
MTRTTRRGGRLVIALIAFVALAALAAGCGSGDGTDETTTSSAPSTTVASTEGSTNETTVVEGGKSLAEYEAEIPDLEKAITADPTDLYALESLAVANYQLGNYEEAAAAYKKILAIKDDAFTRNNLGNVYRDWGKTDEAIAEYEASIALDPTLKYAYVNLAGIYQTKGDIAKALEVLKSGLKYVQGEDAKPLETFQGQLTSTTTT